MPRSRPTRAVVTPDPAAQINLVIDLPTLLGLDERPAQTWEGIGIPAQAARDLAADATLRRLITDPQTGQLLDYGTTTYHVPEPLARFVKARDRRCGFPQCTRRATRRGPATTARGIDLDHLKPYDRTGTAGGPTARASGSGGTDQARPGGGGDQARAGGGTDRASGSSGGDRASDGGTDQGRGGRTDRNNLEPRCRRHHLLKTHLGWHATPSRAGDSGVGDSDSDGTTRWRSPHGRSYRTRPEPLIEPVGDSLAAPRGAPPPQPPLPPLPAGWPGTREAIIVEPDPPF